jgi:hypothetical protein
LSAAEEGLLRDDWEEHCLCVCQSGEEIRVLSQWNSCLMSDISALSKKDGNVLEVSYV